MIADNDHTFPPPQTCPTCGRPLTPPFDPMVSGLLDWLLRVDEDLHHIKSEVDEDLHHIKSEVDEAAL
jgi:hypothetical protein